MIVLVGEHNPLRPEPRFALYPYPPRSAGGRLAKVFDLSVRAYLERFPDRRNLMPHEYDVKHWKVKDARERAQAILRTTTADHRLVLFGKRVSEAFGVNFRENLFEARPMQLVCVTGCLGREVLVLPHPSGRCHEWNDKATAARARKAVEEMEQR